MAKSINAAMILFAKTKEDLLFDILDTQRKIERASRRKYVNAKMSRVDAIKLLEVIHDIAKRIKIDSSDRDVLHQFIESIDCK